MNEWMNDIISGECTHQHYTRMANSKGMIFRWMTSLLSFNTSSCENGSTWTSTKLNDLFIRAVKFLRKVRFYTWLAMHLDTILHTPHQNALQLFLWSRVVWTHRLNEQMSDGLPVVPLVDTVQHLLQKLLVMFQDLWDLIEHLIH